MKQKRIVLVAAIMLVVLGALPADADFYVIGAGGKAGTQITSLPYTINSPGLYCLSKSLTYSATTGNAITVAASNVTLDLMGFTLSGPGKESGSNYGIFINAVENVEIRNGCVTGFGLYGIYHNQYPPQNWIRLLGLRVIGNYEGASLSGGNSTQIIGCFFIDNSQGGVSCGSGLIKGNVVSGNGFIGMGVNGVISCNVCQNNGWSGMVVGNGSSVLDNSCLNNGSYGIFVNGEGCTIKGNSCWGNAYKGIKTGDNCCVTNNTTQGLIVGRNCINTNNCIY